MIEVGAFYLGNSQCQFVVWAPLLKQVAVNIVGSKPQVVPMQQDEQGYWRVVAEEVEPEDCYFYQLNGEIDRPDPASRSQPTGVHGYSQVVDQSFQWLDSNWSGVGLQDMILYEIHVGTFTPQGTFEAIISRLPRLKELGITAVEIMPVAQVPGQKQGESEEAYRNWGYDGVYPYAVQNSYGGVNGLKQLVDACHQQDIAVVLDVVYNHLGPEGNYLGNFAPYFTSKFRPIWGEALNFDDAYCDGVRNYFLANALYWFETFHVDALRLDAIQGIYDLSAKHFLEELTEKVAALSQQLGRKLYLTAESDLNDVRLIRPQALGGYDIDAQWCDDFHHALHTLITGEQHGYYQDFGQVEDLAKSLREGFIYSGQYAPDRHRCHGNSSIAEPAHQFIICSQNHDQTGNRILGERLTQLTSFEGLKLTAAVILLSPYVPLLFMGEEYAEPAPFLYFISHSDRELVAAIQQSKDEEFKQIGYDGESYDPHSPEIFEQCKLNWELQHEGEHQVLWQFYQHLIQLRRSHPALKKLDKQCLEITVNERDRLLIMRRWSDQEQVLAVMNFSDRAVTFVDGIPNGSWHKILDTAEVKWQGSGATLPEKLPSEQPLTASAKALPFIKPNFHLPLSSMKIPIATYRLQFHAGFNFEAAHAIAHYLAALGISDLYASPIFKARAGSSHGYDVVDPTQINPEIGTPEQFDGLVNTLQHHQIGWLQDIVPNHMAYDSENQYLMDVLENGPDSEAIEFFDIEWNHAYESFKGRVLAPLLGDLYGNCLENGDIQLTYKEMGLNINYHSLKLPVRIESYARFITTNLGQLTKALGRKHPDFIKLLGSLYLIKSIPAETKGRERSDQIEFVKGLLWELYNQNTEIKNFFDANVISFNGIVHTPESFNLLDDLLSEQFYRLSSWKVGAEEINYRRFFTVNELISVKVETIKVFHKTHALIEQWIKDGKVTGLRVDHIDGLYHPAEYLERLREKVGDVYITVEKILELQEQMPDEWQTEGTSGYEFLNYLNGVFCQSQNESDLQTAYTRFTGTYASYEQLVAKNKHLIIEKNLGGDVDNLAQRLKSLSGQTRQGVDFTAYGLKRSLSEVLALFPVYRTYVASEQVSEVDRGYIQAAIAQAKEQIPLLVNELNYIEKILLRQDEEWLTESQKEERLHFVMKFQQLTGPLMAKGVEDTTLYIYNRLLSLNEVGGNPNHFGITLEQFHGFNRKKCDRWLHSMNASATHDTKRGEDVRARLNVLSEIPAEWEEQVKRWAEINQDKKQQIKGKSIPDRNDEYFLYQTLVGAFPFAEADTVEFRDRIKDYIIKAIREAKVHTAWLRPDSIYEDGYLDFIDKLLDFEAESQFLQEFRPFQKQIADYGIFNSLSQVLLKNTSPGAPDLYQGCELWDLSLVDPDNRRPVDYAQRQAYLQDIQAGMESNCLNLIKDLLTTKADGRVKLFLTYQVLQARQNYQMLFQQGDYQPLEVSGIFADHVIAFARTFEGQVAIAIASRFLTHIVQPNQLPLGHSIWQDTQINLPSTMPINWINAITQQPLLGKAEIKVGDVLEQFPVALLISQN